MIKYLFRNLTVCNCNNFCSVPLEMQFIFCDKCSIIDLRSLHIIINIQSVSVDRKLKVNKTVLSTVRALERLFD